MEIALVAAVMLLLMGLYWSLVLFPRQRAFVKRQEFARSLAKGDEVITYGGLIGKVIDIDADSGVTYLEIADGVVIRVLNVAVMQAYDSQLIAQNAQIGRDAASAPPANHVVPEAEDRLPGNLSGNG